MIEVSDTPRRPPPDYNTGGWRHTGTVRLRSSWFGFARAEELCESRDGAKWWQPIVLPIIVRGEE